MKVADVVLILVGLGGLALGGVALYRAQQPSLAQGPIAAAQPAPAATATVTPQPAAQTVANDVGKTISDALAFVDGLGGTIDSIGKFFDRF